MWLSGRNSPKTAALTAVTKFGLWYFLEDVSRYRPLKKQVKLVKNDGKSAEVRVQTRYVSPYNWPATYTCYLLKTQGAWQVTSVSLSLGELYDLVTIDIDPLICFPEMAIFIKNRATVVQTAVEILRLFLPTAEIRGFVPFFNAKRVFTYNPTSGLTVELSTNRVIGRVFFNNQGYPVSATIRDPNDRLATWVFSFEEGEEISGQKITLTPEA
jgi:hypothetical protein